MNTFWRVCSCHIKAQWSDHSHDICFNWPAEVCYSADMEHDRKQRSLSDAPLPGKLGKPSASGKVRARMVSGLCNASRYLCGCLSISPLRPSTKLSVSFFCLKRLLFTHTSLGSFAQCFRLGFLFLLQKDLASQTSWQLHLQNTSYSVAAETWPGAHYPAFVE